MISQRGVPQARPQGEQGEGEVTQPGVPRPGRELRQGDLAAAQLLTFDQLAADERPRAGDRVLLLGLIWGGATLVELEQVGPGGDLRAGRLFDLPVTGLPGNFKIVRHLGDDLVLTLPASLRSEVRHGSEVSTLEQLAAAGRARRIEAPFRGHALVLRDEDRVVVRVGPRLDLVARYVRARRQPAGRFLDLVDGPFSLKLAVGLLLFLLTILLLRSVPHTPGTMADDLTRNPARFARYMVKPSQKPKAPPKKDLSGLKAGAKAKDEEGRFGKPEAKQREADPSRPGAPVVDPNRPERDRQVVMKSGLLAALSKLGAGGTGTPATSDVLGPGGLGHGINEALGGVKRGAGQGDAYGVHGLGVKGGGSGGGGTAQGIGGLSTKGDGPGRGGYGEVDLGGKGKEETQFIPGKTTLVGGLSREVVNRVIQRHWNEIKYCYEKELSKDPALYGKVAVQFVIEESGRVGDVSIRETSLSNEAVESCMTGKVQRWVFPAAQGMTQVTYPYVFKAGGQ